MQKHADRLYATETKANDHAMAKYSANNGPKTHVGHTSYSLNNLKATSSDAEAFNNPSANKIQWRLRVCKFVC